MSPSVSLSVCLYMYMFMRPNVDRTCQRSPMLAFVCVHARVVEGECLSPYIRPSVCLSVCLSASMLVRPNV